jgi:exodeoxyribonuclease V alpha subunit
MARGRKRQAGQTYGGAATASRPRSAGGYRREPKGAAASRDWVDHATILKKLVPAEGQPEYETGFTVAIARDEATGHDVKLAGTFGPVAEGDLIAIKNNRAAGKEPPWRDSSYGPEYQVWGLDHADPITRDAVASYLRNLPGVGDILSDRIIATFGGENGGFDGASLLAKIDADPNILKQVRGLHGHRIQADLDELIGSWDALRGERKEMLYLSSMGLGDSTSKKVRQWFREHQADPVAVVKDNPYALTEVPGISFRLADAVARKQKIAFDDPRRLGAGLEYVLERASENGHMCLFRDELVALAPRALAVDKRRPDAAKLQGAIDEQVGYGRLISYTDPVDGKERLYSKEQYVIESRLYEKLHGLLTHEKLERPETVPTAKPADVPITEEQWQAVVNVFEEKVSILHGGPGTGKTTTLKSVLDVLDQEKQTYLCLAPTGKAAKRMQESTGRKASTYHRQLARGGGLNPPRSLTEKGYGEAMMQVDVVVVDESSMLDAAGAERIMTHLGPDTRLLLVGDPDQLPPVGAGAVLQDLLDSERVPTAHLTEVFRQAENSLLVLNAHRIKDGLEPFWTKKAAEEHLRAEAVAAGEDPADVKVREDWKLIETGSPESALARVQAEIDRLARDHDLPAAEVMVASPFRKGETGVHKLNKVLQEKNNPRGQVIREGEEKPIRVDDVVMNVKNRYANPKKPEIEHDVTNGEVGHIVEWDAEKKIAWIDFDEPQGPQSFQGEDLENIVPAYAATIHKLQGSQAPALVAPLTAGESDRLVTANHIYTAWTRAESECVVVVDSKETLLGAISRKFERQTALDLRVGSIEKRIKAAWEKVALFDARWREYTDARKLPQAARPTGFATGDL